MTDLSIPDMQHFVFKNTTMQQASPPTHARARVRTGMHGTASLTDPCRPDSVSTAIQCPSAPLRPQSRPRWMNAPSKQITMPRFEPPYLTKKAQRSTLRLYQHIESRMLQHAKPHKL